MNFLVAVAGWSGAAVVVVAYALLSAGVLDGRSRLYHLLNITGAAGIAINSGWNGAIASVAVNVIWASLAIYGLVAARTNGRRNDSRSQSQPHDRESRPKVG